MSLVHGNCIDKLKEIDQSSVDLIYLDTPFFTQKTHSLKTRDNSKEYQFDDSWDSLSEYLDFMKQSLLGCRDVLKNTGSLFLHCDKSASHYLRVILDEVFGEENFQSEIIWTYKRWSNSRKGLLNNHQNIYFYSKTKDFKFNTLYTDYSPTTNIDQILQERIRDENGKSAYKKDKLGNSITGSEKKGVPLSDVWEIPFLNPKPKERYGYPTQKPILLLEQILKIASDENDLVLDPFCGSGTTLVTAKILNRRFIGIDISQEALNLAERRLKELIMSESNLLKKGKDDYINKTDFELAILKSIDATPVQRNSGIDGFLKNYYFGKPVPVKIQKKDESLQEAKRKLTIASKTKNSEIMVLIRTNSYEEFNLFNINNNSNILIIDSYDLIIQNWINKQDPKSIKELVSSC